MYFAVDFGFDDFVGAAFFQLHFCAADFYGTRELGVFVLGCAFGLDCGEFDAHV